MTRTAADASLFSSELRRIEAEVGRQGPLWLRRLQTRALERFLALGFPTTRDEDWRQTNVSALAATPFRRVAPEASLSRLDLENVPFADLDCPRLTFVDGRFAPGLSTTGGFPPGVSAGSLALALRTRPQEVEPHLARHAAWKDQAFAALNTALFEDGPFVAVSPGCVLLEPLHVLHVSSGPRAPSLACPRTLAIVGDHGRLVLVETYVALGDAEYFTNAVSEIVVGENATALHCRVQRDGDHAHHVAGLHAHQARNSRYVSLNVSLGSLLTRNDVTSVLAGEGGECTLNGLYVVDGKQHVDNHTTIDHARPHCVSHEMYKGVLAGSARAVFNGRIVVREGAQKTDAKQSNRNLLLADDAVVHTRPQLEIYADDVKCTHGATIGQLDEDALFYLRSRGIGHRAARNVLIHAFASSVLDGLEVRALSTALEADVAAKLDRGVAQEPGS